MAIFHVIKYDAKCCTCLRKFECRETTLSNAANHFKIFLIEFEICLYKHLYFLYIRNPLFPIIALIYMLWKLKVNMFYQKNIRCISIVFSLLNILTRLTTILRVGSL